MVEPILADGSGCDHSALGVAFCPECVPHGRTLRNITVSYPKLLGGVDNESTRAARLLYIDDK